MAAILEHRDGLESLRYVVDILVELCSVIQGEEGQGVGGTHCSAGHDVYPTSVRIHVSGSACLPGERFQFQEHVFALWLIMFTPNNFCGSIVSRASGGTLVGGTSGGVCLLHPAHQKSKRGEGLQQR